MEANAHRPTWKMLLAFAIIYFVWGSTYFAIRVGVREVPPFLLAAMRFLVAGLVLYSWMIAQGERSPSGRQWVSASMLAILFFVLDYGLVFWAEQRVPSGIAAVMMATIPVFMAVSEIIFLRTQKLTVRLALALLIGIGGVAVLMSHSLSLGGAPIDRVSAVALIVASMNWSVASVLTRKLPLPPSEVMSSGAQMLVGGLFLTLTAAALGEFRNFHPWTVSRGAWFSLLYLIVPGSLIAFTAYVWLIHHESPTKVGTYAYVNPVVAVLIGYFLGGEGLGLRTILGTLFVLISVVVITTTRAKKGLTSAKSFHEKSSSRSAAGVYRDRRYLKQKLDCGLYFARRLLANLDGLRSPKSLPSISALWVVHTSLMMTPCTHEARYVAGLEQSRTSQMPALTGSKYGSGFLAAIEDSPVHFAAIRLGRFKRSGLLLTASTIGETADNLASYPVCGLHVWWHRNRRPRRARRKVCN